MRRNGKFSPNYSTRNSSVEAVAANGGSDVLLLRYDNLL
jgi:hypothetical protein